ncbi:MAG: hypothetical protein AAB019_05330 [Planctomycetota bacterium]
MKKIIPFIVVFLVVIVAAVSWSIYQYWFQKDVTDRKMVGVGGIINTTPEVAHRPPEKIPSDSPGKDQPGPAVKPELVPPPDVHRGAGKVDAELSAAERLIKEIEGDYQKLDWNKALEKLESALITGADQAVQKQGEELKNKCETFRKLLVDIPPEAMVPLVDLVRIELISGRFLEGQLVQRTGQGLQVRFKEFTGEIPLDQIYFSEEIKPEARKLELEREYEKYLELLPADPTAYQYYELAVRGYKSQLGERILPMLEKAWEKNYDLIAVVQEEEARDLYERGLFYRECHLQSKMDETVKNLEVKFPESNYLVKIKEIQSQDLAQLTKVIQPNSQVKPLEPDSSSGVVEGVNELKPIVRNDEAQKLINEANKIYEQGFKHYAKTDERGPDFDEENEKALIAFSKATSLYEQASQTRPDDAWLQDRLRNSRQLWATVRKQGHLRSPR